MAPRGARRRGVRACLAEAASEGPSLRVLARGALLAGPVVLGAERVGPRPVGARQAPSTYTRPVAPEIAGLTVLGRVVAARGHGGFPAGAPRADLKPRAVAVRVNRAVGARGLVDGPGRVAIFARGAVAAGVIGLVLWLVQVPVLGFALTLFEGSIKAETLASTYFHIRVWSAPAVLLNYCLKLEQRLLRNYSTSLVVV